MKIFFISLVFVFCIVSCSVGKKGSKQATHDFSVTFGKTGGFTNINPSYTVNSGGEVFKKENKTSDPQLIRKLSTVQTDSVFILLNESRFMDLKINFPSNITNFIEVGHDSITNRIQWRDESQIPPAVQKLHSYLLSVIKN